MVWSTFVVTSAMTGNIVRHANNSKPAVAVTAVAFIFSNIPFMIMGALIPASINDTTVVYLALANMAGASLGATLSRTKSGAEAE